MKKIIPILLVVILLCGIPGTGLAASDSLTSNGEISIQMVHIMTYSCNLNISSSGLSASSANVTAYSGTDSVKISLYLQRYSSGWSTIQHWTAEADGAYLSMTRNYYVSSGYTYRVLAYLYAYEGTDVESTSCTNSEYY